jgi:hypothetical protein
MNNSENTTPYSIGFNSYLKMRDVSDNPYEYSEVDVSDFQEYRQGWLAARRIYPNIKGADE